MGLARALARVAAQAALLCACAHQPIARRPAFQPGLGLGLGDLPLANPPQPGVVHHVRAVPSPDAVQARLDARAPRRASPAQIPRAGGARSLDPAAHGQPLGWPTPGVLISGFGTRERDAHEGIDLAAPEGTPVCAAEDGTVLFAGEQRGYGNLVLLAHKNDLVTVYAHNEKNLVRKGQNVARGETIARIGHTGNATGPHLHFEVRVAARPRDPLGFLR